jgi:16S rRNA (guanine527-N7)-methyltransferase
MEKLAEQITLQTGVRMTARQMSSLARFEEELLDWNSRMNLTAIRTAEEIRIKHFLDSLTCAPVMRESPPTRVIDIGTGAGFPGLVLKIAFPALQLTLVESVGKKVKFCQHITDLLGLDQVTIVQDRAEAMGQQRAHRQQYDLAVARAVASMPVLAEYLLPLVRVGGRILAMKGESAPAEAHAAEYAFRVLGGELHQLLPVHLPGVAEDRYLVVVNKIAATPPGYPRRVGLPSQRPIHRK